MQVRLIVGWGEDNPGLDQRDLERCIPFLQTYCVSSDNINLESLLPPSNIGADEIPLSLVLEWAVDQIEAASEDVIPLCFILIKHVSRSIS